jgi:hypothetical protein
MDEASLCTKWCIVMHAGRLQGAFCEVDQEAGLKLVGSFINASAFVVQVVLLYEGCTKAMVPHHHTSVGPKVHRETIA